MQGCLLAGGEVMHSIVWLCPDTWLAVGLILGGLYLAGFLVSLIVQLMWAWIDDGEYTTNWWFNKTAAIFGNERNDKRGYYSYLFRNKKTGTGTDGFPAILACFFTLFLGPVICLVLFIHIQFTATIALIFACTIGARYVRRLSKKFGVHVIDPNAHKVEEKDD